jgi:hypothetical protein
MHVVEIDALKDPRWDSFVSVHPDALVYHHSAWLQALLAEYSQAALSLASVDPSGNVTGVFPLLYTRGLPLRRGSQAAGRRLASLPRTPLAGPLASDDQSLATLVAAAAERVRSETDLELQIRVRGPSLDGIFDGMVRVPWWPSYVVQLPDSTEEIRFGNSRNHERVKWSIGKAKRFDVRVRLADDESDLRTWYQLYLATMRSHALPPRPYRFFAAQWTHLRPRGLMELVLAERRERNETRVLAGSIFLRFGKTVFYAFNGRDRESLVLRPNDVIMWHAIHDACRDGYRWCDLGEVADGHPGLTRFKQKWGARPVETYRYYYPASRQPDKMLRGGPPPPLVAAVWRRLPLHATAFIGERLFRYF